MKYRIKNYIYFFLYLFLNLYTSILINCGNSTKNKEDFKKVAIIGSGIGGSSAAYFLLKENENIKVDIFEKNSRVGGRVYSEQIAGEVMDLGASFFIKENKLIYSIIKELSVPYKNALDYSEPIAFFRDRQILFKSTGWSVIDLLKLVWKYGLSPFRMYFSLKNNLLKFLKIYEILSSKQTLNSLDDFLQGIQLKHLLHMTIEEFMQSENVSQSFIDEIVSGMIAGIYNQHKEINAFAGFITLAGINYTPYKIVGGNNVIVQKLIETLNDTFAGEIGIKSERFKLNFKSVTEILNKQENNKFILLNKEQFLGEYDYVIIACPLLKSEIKFPNLSIDENDKFPKKFQTNHKTIIYGQIRPDYFKNENPNEKSFVYSLLSVNKTISYNTSEFMAKRIKNGTIIHIQSDNKLNFDELKEKGLLKDNYKTIFEYHWDYAYPKLEKIEENQNLPKFKISEKLFHINAIELAGSCMEMSIISARNIVNIIQNELKLSKNNSINHIKNDL